MALKQKQKVPAMMVIFGGYPCLGSYMIQAIWGSNEFLGYVAGAGSLMMLVGMALLLRYERR